MVTETPEAPVDLDSEQSELIEEWLALKAEPPEDKDTVKGLRKVGRRLDGLYWKRVSSFVAQRIADGKSTLSFTEDERLIIDMGLLDPALVENADPGLTERLLAEMKQGGTVNHYYFSEWLEDRYRKLLLTAQVEAQTEVQEAAANTELAKLSDARSRLFASLAPQFDGLPGVPPQILKSILSGGLDDQLQVMGIGLIEEPERAGFVRRHRLRNLRASVLTKVRARLTGETDFKRMDALESLYEKIWNDRYRQYETEGISHANGLDLESATASATAAKMGDLLDAEIKFAKSLLPLGALAGGISKASPVMTQDRPRITKADIQRRLSRARECDRGFTAEPVVMIAPFEGRGIFEWDRDSLVIPINPVAGIDDAIANAAGNYRMLIDSFQQEGHLKKAYEAAFTESNFQAAFQTDYRAWVCAVGQGSRDGMAEDRFHFFRQHVGPDVSGVLGPATLLHLGPEARSTLAKQLEKQIRNNPQNANLLYRRGVIHWQEGNLQEAIRHLAKALTLESHNGIATFSLGLILQRSGNEAKSEQAFRACMKRDPESIWAVYAALALEGKLT